MADDAQVPKKAPKTKVIGSLPKTAAMKLKGYPEYLEKARALTAARKAAEKAKDVIRDALAPIAASALKQQKRVLEGELDFMVDDDGTVRLFEDLTARGRTKAFDLSVYVEDHPQ